MQTAEQLKLCCVVRGAGLSCSYYSDPAADDGCVRRRGQDNCVSSALLFFVYGTVGVPFAALPY